MTSPPLGTAIVTSLQFSFLVVLMEKSLTGKQMRAELAECGVHKNEAAFWRVMQRLKQESLVEATRIARDEGEYRGSQAVYEITEGGRDAVALIRGLCQRVDRRVRRLRWGGRRHAKRSAVSGCETSGYSHTTALQSAKTGQKSTRFQLRTTHPQLKLPQSQLRTSCSRLSKSHLR